MDRRSFLFATAAAAPALAIARERELIELDLMPTGLVAVERAVAVAPQDVFAACQEGFGVEVSTANGDTFFVGPFKGQFIAVRSPDIFGSGPTFTASHPRAFLDAFEADPAILDAVLACEALYGKVPATAQHRQAVARSMPTSRPGRPLCAHTLNYQSDAIRLLFANT